MLTLAVVPIISSCGYYSFTGAVIPSHLNTIAIPLAEDNSISTLVSLDESLTALLVDRFVGQTRLSLQPDQQQADALLTSRIDRYVNQPASVGGQERATLNRVTISVTTDYIDRTKDEVIFTRSFSSFEEYDPTDPERGLSGEEDAARAVLEKIADDIFTAATSNW
ncbi:MAG: LPS assembly lipoprotein LptE [Rhodothermales bacterium]|nr:LPS assembly lipoprotein LptE [Rhodothermales bacterium]